MHYYKRNLGDYYQKAGRLSMLQHGSYTLLIDACYDREKFPTKEDAMEWAWASSSAEIEAVEFVLNKFFTLENGVYVQTRIKEEIEKYHANAETNQRIAIERETKRKEKSTNRVQCVDEAPPNQEPVTNNQEPETKKKALVRAARLPADWVLPKTWGEWALTEKPTWTPEHVRKVAESFRDFWIAKSGSGAAKLDWLATWRVWVRKESDLVRKESGMAGSVAPIVHKCGFDGCVKNANLQTSKGHRCTEHM